MKRFALLLLSLVCLSLTACSSLPWPGNQDVAQASKPGQPLPFRVSLHSKAHDPVLHDMVVAAAFSPDNKYVAIGSMHAYDIVIWDIEHRRTVRHLKMPGGIDRDALAWSPDGRYVVSYLGQTVYVFDPFTGVKVQELILEPAGGAPSSVRFNLDGSRLLVSYILRDKAVYNLAIFDTSIWSKQTFNTRPTMYLQSAFWAGDQIMLVGDKNDENVVRRLDPVSGTISGNIKLTSEYPSELIGNRLIDLGKR